MLLQTSTMVVTVMMSELTYLGKGYGGDWLGDVDRYPLEKMCWNFLTTRK